MQSPAVRHLYVHVPFCAHRCGYCDFVTAVGRHDQHDAYVDALLRELELRRGLLSEELETVYLGGGTPTYLAEAPLKRLLSALPRASELTVEANPETVTSSLATLLVDAGVNRVSLGVQSFDPRLLSVLERHAGPDDASAAVSRLRASGLDNLSLDLIYGIPGQQAEELESDLAGILGLDPEHVSAYELEAKPGTRFTHAHGRALEQQADTIDHYMQLVTETLSGAGYSWYETASFCRAPGPAGGRDLRSRHNRGYWLGRDYLGVGIGAVSTVGQGRWQNRPGLAAYVSALERGKLPPASQEALSPGLRLWERAMLGLRLEEGVLEREVQPALEPLGLERMIGAGLLERRAGRLRLTSRGRLLGDGVTGEALADPGGLGTQGDTRATSHREVVATA